MLAFLVISPGRVSLGDPVGLSLLVAAAKQNNDSLAVLAEIDAVAWAKVDLVLVHARAHTLNV